MGLLLPVYILGLIILIVYSLVGKTAMDIKIKSCMAGSLAYLGLSVLFFMMGTFIIDHKKYFDDPEATINLLLAALILISGPIIFFSSAWAIKKVHRKEDKQT